MRYTTPRFAAPECCACPRPGSVRRPGDAGAARPLAGDRLTIMTNGRGPGVMAMDTHRYRGRLASLSQGRYGNSIRSCHSAGRDNPVDIMDDAPVERYVQTLQNLLGDRYRMRCCSSMHRPPSFPARKSRRRSPR
jgi:acyl-CoA synthetase (NDP forming)